LFLNKCQDNVHLGVIFEDICFSSKFKYVKPEKKKKATSRTYTGGSLSQDSSLDQFTNILQDSLKKTSMKQLSNYLD